MGKNSNTTLRQGLKAVDKLGRQMTREADADYAISLSALAAGTAGLSKQTRGLTRDLLAGQLTQTTSLSKLAKTARAQKNVVAQAQSATTNRYGSALGQSVAQSFATARSIAAGTGKVVTGAAQAGKATASVAGTVAGIAQAGVAAQQAAAKYSLNQALQQRAIVDSQTLAGLTGQLYSQALQYNADLAMYERQRADARRDAKKAAKDAENLALESTLNILSDAGPGMYAWLNDPNNMVPDGEGIINIAETVAAMTGDLGLNPALPQDAIILNAATFALRGMRAGDGIDAGLQTGLDSLYSSMPGWDQSSSSVYNSIVSGGTSLQTTRDLAAANAISAGGGGSDDVTTMSSGAPAGLKMSFGNTSLGVTPDGQWWKRNGDGSWEKV